MNNRKEYKSVDTVICEKFGISESRKDQLSFISNNTPLEGETSEEGAANALDKLFESKVDDIRESMFLSFMLGMAYAETEIVKRMQDRIKRYLS